MRKFFIKWIFKKEIALKTFLIVFVNQGPFLEYQPGQFASIEIRKGQRRSYSFVYVGKEKPSFLQELPELDKNEEYWVFLISTRSGGFASQFFETEEPKNINKNFLAIAPMGRFTLLSDDPFRTKIFICTGTGLAPIINMLKQTWEKFPKAKTELFFGISQETGNYALIFLDNLEKTKINFRLHTCFSPFSIEQKVKQYNIEQKVKQQILKEYNGTVTEIVPEIVDNFQSEFYICGNPLMVLDVKKILEQKQAKKIIVENFGPLKK